MQRQLLNELGEVDALVTRRVISVVPKMWRRGVVENAGAFGRGGRASMQ